MSFRIIPAKVIFTTLEEAVASNLAAQRDGLPVTKVNLARGTHPYFYITNPTPDQIEQYELVK